MDFTVIKAAYDALSDPSSRSAYDAALLAAGAALRPATLEAFRGEVVSLSSLPSELVAIETDDGAVEEGVARSHGCRCGEVYELLDGDLEGEGMEVECEGCGLRIYVTR